MSGTTPAHSSGLWIDAAPPSAGVRRRIHEAVAAATADLSAAKRVRGRIDLKGNRGWPAPNQGRRPMCTAFAATAAVEILKAAHSKTIPQYSAAFEYFHMRTDQKPPGVHFQGDEKGFTRFEDAQRTLAEVGYCDLADWGDNLEHAPRPLPPVKGQLVTTALPFPPVQGVVRSGLASLVYAELLAGRPVVIGMPQIVLAGTGGLTNWDDAWRTGLVGRRKSHGDLSDPDSVHAFCVFGFTTATLDGKSSGKDGTPSDTDVKSGWFMFRNSFGTQFASDPETTGLEAGFGLLPAGLVETDTWGLLLMREL